MPGTAFSAEEPEVTNRVRLTSALLGVALAIVAGQATAAPITWQFTGILRSVPALPPPLTGLGVVVGAPLTGFVRFESETPDSDSRVDSGNFDHAILDAGIAIGGWSLSLGTYTPNPGLTANYILANTNSTRASQQIVTDLNDPTGAFTSSVLFGIEINSPPGAQWWVNPVPGSAIDVLPTDPPSLGAVFPYSTTELTLIGTPASGSGLIDVQLTSLARVPEPGAAILALLSLAALAASRRSSRS